jgi:precorrin-6Y C5,15-methyltransferase (decarboxylating)
LQQPSTNWLTFVGLGASGIDSLTEPARAALSAAKFVFGSARQLALVAPLLRAEKRAWPSPFSQGLELLFARRGEPTCVLASGDPFFYGIGATLAPHLTPSEYVCFSAPSSVSLAAAKLGWSLQDVEVVSLHGRELSIVVRSLQPRRRLFVLSWDRRTPRALAELLVQRGFGSARLFVLEELGGSKERVRNALASEFCSRADPPASTLSFDDVQDLNLIGVELSRDPSAMFVPLRGSLPDNAFEHDGQLTKQDVRAVTMSALAPRPHARLWDVGAGAGSISIEWLLSHPSASAIAIEKEPERAARIARNASALGVPNLQVIEAEAPAGLVGLAAPDAIFVGGGVGNTAIFEACLEALGAGGRLVMNAVSLESEAQLIRWQGSHGGELRRLAIDKAEPLGTVTGWRRAMPVTQWRLTKS